MKPSLEKDELIRWAVIALLVIALLIGVNYALGLTSSLHRNIGFLKKQIKQAEVLIEHAAHMDANQLRDELEQLDQRLQSPLEISHVLEELNRLGDENGIHFVSVEPSNSDKQNSILIRMEIEGSYEALGEFLGALDGLDTAIARVRNFDLKSQGATPRLLMKLEIELYRPEPEIE